MNARTLNVPTLQPRDLARIREVAQDPESRKLAEHLLRKIQESLIIADRNLRATEDAIKRLEDEREKWRVAHDACLQREQAVQSILDETQGSLKA